MTFIKLPILITLLAFTMSSMMSPHPAHAQDTTTASQPASDQSSSYDGSAYTNAPFDLSLSKLPAKYKGIDPVLLCANLAKNFADKSEFETTEAYKARVQKAKTDPIIDKVTPQSLIAFQIDPDKISTTYDADKQQLQVRINRWNLFTKVTDLGTSDEQNGFGATFTVVKVKTVSIYLAHSDETEKNIGFTKSNNPDTSLASSLITLPMDTSTAIKVKPNICVVAVGQLIEQKDQVGIPYVLASASTHQPTMRSPYDAVETTIYIEFVLNEVLIYNSATGDIMLTLKQKGMKH